MMTFTTTNPQRGVPTTALLLSLLGLLFLSGCPQGEAAQEDAGENEILVAVHDVTTRSIAKILTYSGDVHGEIEVKVYSMIPDRIVSLSAEEGQLVVEGQMLAKVRSDALSQGVQQAQGGLAAMQAQVDGLRDTLTRQEQLLSSGITTQSQVDSTRFQLQAADAQVSQMRATVGSARTKQSEAFVRAPISGIIGQVFVEEGDLAAMQIPICTIVRMDRVEVQIQVPERELGSVRQGMNAELRFETLPGRVFRAPISQISPVVDRLSRTATLRIMLDNPDRLIRPGSLADVRIEVERHDDAVVIPLYALVLNDHSDETQTNYRAYVLAQDHHTAEERTINVGFFDGDEVEVLSGLRQGDQLIVEGQHLLTNGKRVKLSSSARPQPSAGDAGSAE